MTIDIELCRRIERAEARGLRDALEFGMAHYGLEMATIAGATVGFAGADSPFSQAVGMGIDAELRETDVEAIIEFYHTRGVAARVITAPIAGSEVSRSLIRHGFTIDEYENALAADLTHLSGVRDARIEWCRDAKIWAEHSARAFTDGQNPPGALRLVSEMMASHPNVFALALTDGGDIQTTGCLALERDGIAAFFGTATAPGARGRGYQTALIADRIARAIEGGATLARATAKAVTASERNFRKLGFSVLYTRTVWRLCPP